MSDCSLYCVLLENRIKSLDRITEVIASIEDNIENQAPSPAFTAQLVTLNTILVNLLANNPNILFVPGVIDQVGDVLELLVKKCNSCFTNTLNRAVFSFVTTDQSGTVITVPLSAVDTTITYSEGYCYLVGTTLAAWVADAKSVLQTIKACCCEPSP